MRALSSLRVLHLLRIPRKCPCQDQGISDREQAQSGKMQKLRLHCKLCIICKRAERVDGGMDEDAGEQTAAAGKDRDQQEADRDRKDDLAQIADKLHPAAVEQVDDMPDAERHA